MARAIHPVMVGTAGHIDHGKSSLVRALTGIDPDRLKEEKERGLTIDLGFARMKMADGRWLGMIDVPGHERFVRNMVAGSTGLDLAILVVAADDGVMPQSVEHLDILHVLGVRGGLVALTKVDLVDAEMVDLAEEEILELIDGTVLENAEIVRVSSATGQGIDEFRDKLESLAMQVEPRSHGGSFRMPIQRVFTLKGIGTVITGIPLSGGVRAGDEIEILPIGERVKVRALQAYGGKVDEVVAGHSSALSVPDAREAGVRRGMVAAEPDVFTSGDAVDLELEVLDRGHALEHRDPIRFHTGTSELRGVLLLLDRDRLEPGQAATVRVLLDDEVCCAHGDRYLLRLQNPVVTVGGGTVLRLTRSQRRYRRRALGEELYAIREAGSRPEARILHEVTQAGPQGMLAEQLAPHLAMDARAVQDTLEDMPEVHVHQKTGRAWLNSIVEAGERELMQSVEKILARRPLAASIKRSGLRHTRTLPQELIDAVLELLQESGRIRTGSQGRILFLDRLVPLQPADQKRLDKVVAVCTEAGFRPPGLEDLEGATGLKGDSLLGILDRAQDEALVEKVGEHFYAAATVRTAMRAVRANCLRHEEVLDIPELRDELGTSRKYLIPLLEHIDAMGLTVLRAGVRRLLSTSELNRELAGEGA